jgi:hypothetical protein
MMREHVPQETRIDSIITRGGSAPNLVRDFGKRWPGFVDKTRLADRKPALDYRK